MYDRHMIALPTASPLYRCRVVNSIVETVLVAPIWRVVSFELTDGCVTALERCSLSTPIDDANRAIDCCSREMRYATQASVPAVRGRRLRRFFMHRLRLAERRVVLATPILGQVVTEWPAARRAHR